MTSRQLVDFLEQGFRARTAKIQQLQQDNEKAQAQLRVVLPANEELIKRQEDWLAALNKANSVSEKFATRGATLSREHAEMAGLLAKAKEALGSSQKVLSAQTADSETTITKLKEDNQHILARAKIHETSAEKNIAQKEDEIQTLRQTLGEMQQQLRALEKQNHELEKETSRVKQKNKKEVQDMRLRYDDTLVELCAEAGKVGNQQTELLKEKVSMLTRDNETLERKVQELASKVQSYSVFEKPKTIIPPARKPRKPRVKAPQERAKAIPSSILYDYYDSD